YELISGRPPIRGQSKADTLRRVASELPTPLIKIRPSIPRDLDAICERCLSKDPAERYSSAADLFDDLTNFLEGRPTAARPIGAVRRWVRWSRRRPAEASLVGVVGLFVLVASFLGWFHAMTVRTKDEAIAQFAHEKDELTADVLEKENRLREYL